MQKFGNKQKTISEKLNHLFLLLLQLKKINFIGLKTQRNWLFFLIIKIFFSCREKSSFSKKNIFRNTKRKQKGKKEKENYFELSFPRFDIQISD